MLSILGDNQKALDYLEKAIEIYKSLEVDNKSGIAESLNNIGIANRNLKEYSKAIEYHEKSIAIYKNIKDGVN